MDYIFKRQKPSVGLGDFITAVPKNDKKFRVRALLKCKFNAKYREEVIIAWFPEQKEGNIFIENEY